VSKWLAILESIVCVERESFGRLDAMPPRRDCVPGFLSVVSGAVVSILCVSTLEQFCLTKLLVFFRDARCSILELGGDRNVVVVHDSQSSSIVWPEHPYVHIGLFPVVQVVVTFVMPPCCCRAVGVLQWASVHDVAVWL
jgi:hypothetical protein